VKAALIRALNVAGSRGPSQTTSSPNQQTRSSVNSNAGNPANSLHSDASNGSIRSGTPVRLRFPAQQAHPELPGPPR
jgi:hypothetical protein